VLRTISDNEPDSPRSSNSTIGTQSNLEPSTSRPSNRTTRTQRNLEPSTPRPSNSTRRTQINVEAGTPRLAERVIHDLEAYTPCTTGFISRTSTPTSMGERDTSLSK